MYQRAHCYISIPVYARHGARGVAQLVEALRYKPEGRGFDSASNRNEYQEYFLEGKGGRCIELTTLPSSYADCVEILGSSTFWNPMGLSRPPW
jgi:hypothetical protein